jgi:hypothetical protein
MDSRIGELLKRLQHGTAVERCTALDDLAALGPAAAVAIPAVLGALGDDEVGTTGSGPPDRAHYKYVRLAAVDALFRIAPEKMPRAREVMAELTGKPLDTNNYAATPDDTYVEFADEMWDAAGGKP